MSELIHAPVLLTVFNRPLETRQVLAGLKQVRPPLIFVAADGPRESRPDDQHLCQEVHRLVAEQIDWPAQVFTDFSSRNLGLRRRMASAISWVLEQEDRVIVLEDDCLPDPSFFRFCTELLDRYAEDRRVGVITGDNFQPEGFDCGASYYFSRYAHCWGWATWRRAWYHYDDAMSRWPKLASTDWLSKKFPHKLEALYWEQIFNDTFHGKVNSWAYRWLFSFWVNEMLCATPNRNLVKNIGVGESATNTKKRLAHHHFIPAHKIKFPLIHPIEVSRNKDADDFVQKTHFGRAKDRTYKGQLLRLISKIQKSSAMLLRSSLLFLLFNI
jgi:glycosyltransferase involved in cell wall biosynthesis